MKTRSDGITFIAIYHFISGFLSLFGACALFSLPLIVGLTMSGYHEPGAGTAVAINAVIGLLIGGLFLLVAAASWIIGWGLWRRRSWARTGAIVLAVFCLFCIPLGTIAGGLVIWYLLREDTRAEFLA